MSDSAITSSLRTAELSPALDAACKDVLKNKIFLAWIMKSCMEEYKDCTIDEIMDKYIERDPEVSVVPVMPGETNTRIRGAANEDSSLTEKTVVFDIRFYASAPGTGEPIGLIINIEAQNKYWPGYSLIRRAIYYCSRMLSAQYGSEFVHSHYEKLKKVYSVWIFTKPPVERQNTVTRYVMSEQNLVGDVKEAPSEYDLLSAIMICLGDPDSPDSRGILRLLNVLLLSKMEYSQKINVFENEFDMTITEELGKEVSEMCNISKGVLEEGIEIGIEKGIEKGIEQGTEKERLSSIRNIMETMQLTAEQAMDALKIPVEDRERYLELLKKSEEDT